MTHLVISLMAPSADGDEFPKELVRYVIIGQVMDFGCWLLPAALAEANGAFKNATTALAPCIGL
jgi:hypothetical protein